MGNVNARNDMERYRNGYPGQQDDPNADQNFRFYSNLMPSRPSGGLVEELHVKWWDDYDLLEQHHGYIQWLFPIREHGMNWDSQPLTIYEIEKIKADPDCIRRFLKSYDMQLNFYGVRVKDRETGELERTEDYRSRYRNLERHGHNYLRITRILKCLGELGFEHYKRPFLEHFIDEIWVHKTLRAPGESCRNYWVETLRSDAEREALNEKIEALSPRPSRQQERFAAGRPPRQVVESDSDDAGEEDDADSENLQEAQDDEEVEVKRREFRELLAKQNAAGDAAGLSRSEGDDADADQERMSKLVAEAFDSSDDEEENDEEDEEEDEEEDDLDEEERDDEDNAEVGEAKSDSMEVEEK